MTNPTPPPPPAPPPDNNRSKSPLLVAVVIILGLLILAGAGLGSIVLVGNNHNNASQQTKVPGIHNTNKNSNSSKQSQARGGSGDGSSQGQSQSQSQVVPPGSYRGDNGDICVSPSVASGTSGCAPSSSITIYQGGWYFITGSNTYIGTIRPPGFTGGEPKAPMNQPSVTVSPPSVGPYTSASYLEQQVGNAQTAALSEAPSSSFDYTGSGSATATVTCTYEGAHTWSCSATDGVGDTGSGDTVTVSGSDQNWADTGMTWTGPYVTSGSYTTPALQG
jgi:hypothetical protein